VTLRVAEWPGERVIKVDERVSEWVSGWVSGQVRKLVYD
jgi:hypothetical protein